MTDNKAGTLTPASSTRMNELARNLERCTPNIQESRSQRSTLATNPVQCDPVIGNPWTGFAREMRDAIPLIRGEEVIRLRDRSRINFCYIAIVQDVLILLGVLFVLGTIGQKRIGRIVPLRD